MEGFGKTTSLFEEKLKLMAFWLVTTEHLEDRLLFRDLEDFIVGMNYVAVQAFKCGVFVLAFILMSNHTHLLLFCSREKAEAFIQGFKTTYSRYLWKKYGSREHLRRLKVDIKPIHGDEALEWTVAYIQMNPVAANICVSPFDYPWGTGRTFFRPNLKHDDVGPSVDLRYHNGDGISFGGGVTERGRPLKAVSDREQARILHSRIKLPQNWVVCDEGYILPDSYVRKDIVEEAFRTPKRMSYFLHNSSKAKQRLDMKESDMPAFRDQVILAAVPDLCQSLFRKRSVEELTEDQMLELLRQLRFRFSAGANQLARVTGLSYDAAAKYLDRG